MQAKNGDKVKAHYTLKDADGGVVESSRDTMAIEFTIGEGKVIPGIEKAVTGMGLNETKTVTVSPQEGYGERDDKKIFKYDRKNAPENFDPRIGDTVQLHRPDGRGMPVTVLAKDSEFITMDANHPLAGKELIFELELLEIEN